MQNILVFIICLLLCFIFWYFIKFYTCLLRSMLFYKKWILEYMDLHIHSKGGSVSYLYIVNIVLIFC